MVETNFNINDVNMLFMTGCLAMFGWQGVEGSQPRPLGDGGHTVVGSPLETHQASHPRQDTEDGDDDEDGGEITQQPDQPLHPCGHHKGALEPEDRQVDTGQVTQQLHPGQTVQQDIELQ